MKLLEIAQYRIENGNDVPSNVIDWLANRYNVTLVITEDGYLADMDETQFCAISESLFSERADMVEFNRYVKVTGGTWSYQRETAQGEREAVEEACFWCDSTREFYLSSDFCAVDVDGDTVCQEACEDSLYYWESDEEYHWTPEPEGIPSYHSCENSDFRNRAKSMKGAGIELEVWTSEANELYDHITGFNGLTGEEDPSLAHGQSLEIISLPETLADWREGKAPIFRALETWAGAIKGHDAGDGYGLHVSLSRSLFVSNLHISKYVIAVNQMAEIGALIAQRANSYNGGFKVRNRVGRALDAGKYEPVKVDWNRVETRIFRSNIRKERIQAKVEYCFAVLDWTRDVSANAVTKEDTASLSFLAFLHGKKKAFPHLTSMLKEKAGSLSCDFRAIASNF